MRKKTVFVGVLLVTAALSFGEEMPFRDASLPIEKRVEDLLSRMTLEEKAVQLDMLRLGQDDNPNNVSETRPFKPLTGSYIIVGTDPARRNEYQRRAVEETRLGIPIIFVDDVLHGFRTIYPIPLAQACSWNPELVEKATRIAAEEGSAAGLNWFFQPMIDVAHDPRWGRVAEGYGEDPYAASVFCVASVRGYQGNDLSRPDSVAACLKHFTGYAASEGGRDYSYTSITDRELWEWYLPPFKAGVDAGAATIMSSFNDINGTPAVCNRYILTEILRNRWGFTGAVVSDWNAVAQLKLQGFSENPRVNGKASLEAGNDIDMVSHIYEKLIPVLIKEKKLPMDTVDEAVRRVLRLKFNKGLFERPYVEVRPESEIFLKKDSLRIAEELAVESMVLLKNKNNVLPIGKQVKSVALVGPLLNDKNALKGCWSAYGRVEDVVSIEDGLRQVLSPDVKITKDPAEADLILLCIGEQAGMSGENTSRARIELPGAELVGQYTRFNKPLVLIFTSGRPVVLEGVEPKVDAILAIWQPGLRGAVALARLLTGEENPSGRLAMTFPRHAGQIPIYYNMHNRSRPFGEYQDLKTTPMYEFGYGLSYTEFKYSNLRLSRATVASNETVTATVTVSNTGKVKGKETVFWYITDPEATITQPIKRLKLFTKIELQPGETKDAVFQINPEEHLSYVGPEGKRILEEGRFIVRTGDQSATFHLQSSVNTP